MNYDRTFNELSTIRKKLHQYPELARKEKQTSNFIKEIISDFNPDEVIENLGGYGIAFIFNGSDFGPKILLRCELDAIPVQESNSLNYHSRYKGISHNCGHDGHMAIMIGVAKRLAKNRMKKGKVILLFQPSEETGEGAQRVLADNKFQKLNPDFVFALHNLPGYEKNTIIIKENNFASASKGMEIKFFGKTAHAAEPENGNTPVLAVSKIIQSLTLLGKNPFLKNLQGNPKSQFKDFSLITIIHTLLGSIAYGTTPGYAEIRATLRTFDSSDMKKLSKAAIEIVRSNCEQADLKYEINWKEEFPVTTNNKDAVKIVKKASVYENLKIKEIQTPFKWSEDFGHFTNNFPGAMFGLGTGKDCAQLHNPNYDFPDEIIEPGITIYYKIIQLLES